jgi:hypothetical protein
MRQHLLPTRIGRSVFPRWYDAAGEMVATVDYQRLPDDTTTGPLTAANSYATASAMWHDGIGRGVEQANYGREQPTDTTHHFFEGSSQLVLTNGLPSVVVNAPPAPDSSDDYIVSQTVYAAPTASGRMTETIDNAGRIDATNLKTIHSRLPEGHLRFGPARAKGRAHGERKYQVFHVRPFEEGD